jgi:hypothetical protein
VISPVSCAILIEADIENPVQTVFDPPMGADRGCERRRVLR